jgi:AcrR family transcriptional regulator
MHNEIVLKKRIAEKALELFCQYSISKVTMGEIAAGLGISKKTLYKFFPNKKDILRAIAESTMTEIDHTLEELINNTEFEFPDKMKKIMSYLAKQSAKLKGPVIDEMKIFYPEFWMEVQEFKKKCSKQRFSTLIGEGVQKGYFRNDIDKDVFVLLYTTSIRNIITPDILSELSLSGDEVYRQILFVLFKGFLSEEGKNSFDCMDAHLG